MMYRKDPAPRPCRLSDSASQSFVLPSPPSPVSFHSVICTRLVCIRTRAAQGPCLRFDGRGQNS